MKRRDRSESEAASWLARLNQPLVAQQDLAAFRRWRESARNDAAFRDVQDTWRRADRLRGDTHLQQALAAARGRPRLVAPVRFAIGAGLAGACLLVVALVATRAPTLVYSTAVGERSTVRLADGSVLQLDTNSRVSVRLSPSRRRLVLDQGQALFSVAKDASRPFTVRAGSLDVVATGTRFNVRRDGPSGPRVVLLEGRVRVRRDGAGQPPVELTPGQALSAARPLPELRSELESSTSWTVGQLTFRDTPLASAAQEANRYTPRHISLEADDRIRDLRISGVFVAGDAPSLARALGQLYGLRTTSTSDGGLRLSLPPTGTTPPPSAAEKG